MLVKDISQVKEKIKFVEIKFVYFLIRYLHTFSLISRHLHKRSSVNSNRKINRLMSVNQRLVSKSNFFFFFFFFFFFLEKKNHYFFLIYLSFVRNVLSQKGVFGF